MKIAYLPGAFFPDPGGAQVQAHNLASVMNDKKFKSEILLLKKSNILKAKYPTFLLNKFIINFIYLFHYYLRIDLTFFLSLYLKKIVVKKKYDIWHFIFLNYKSLLLIKALNKLNEKIIVTFQGADIQVNKIISYGNRIDIKYDSLLNEVIGLVDIFTAISENINKDLQKIGVPKKKIKLIPNGVPLEKFLNLKRKNKKVKSSKIKIITVARYAEKKKGFDLIPRILKELNKEKIKYEWTIVGKNTHKVFKNKEILNNKSKLKIYENLFIKNEKMFPAKKIINKYLEADLYLNLARIESFGITFVEALASNIPIITFDTKGANEIVINKNNGFIIKNNHYKELCKKIIFLSKYKNYFKSRPIESAKKYDLKSLKKKYKIIYQKVL